MANEQQQLFLSVPVTVESTVTALGDHNDTSNSNCSAYSPYVFKRLHGVSTSFSGCGSNNTNFMLSD